MVFFIYYHLFPLVQVGNGIELEAVGLQFEHYRWRGTGALVTLVV